MGKKLKGTCHLCGSYGELSFEHLPPKKAFNNCSVRHYNYFMGISKGNYNKGITKGSYNNQISQRGLGAYTLCESCNNKTGSWYGGAFIEWARQSMDILEYTENQPSLYYRFRIFPVRVIKQIACMMFSVNTDKFRCYHQDLVKFVLNKEEYYLNPDIKFFAFYNAEGFRMSGGMVKVKTNNFNINSLDEFGESVNRMRTKIESHRVLIDKHFKLAVTNAHVTDQQNTIEVYFPAPDENGELIRDRSFYLTSGSVLKRLGYYTKGHVIAKNETTDLAIIRLDGLPETAREIDWGVTTPKTNAGNLVYILGNPGGQDLWRWTLGEFLNDSGDFLHIQSDVFGGNSGGPVLNKQGILIGIVALSDRHMNAAAIPVRYINELLSKSQLEHSRSRR